MNDGLVFKPKARLLLQLGEQLIRNESVALLELVKNAYDADAKRVVVSMSNIENTSLGRIVIEDNGNGMDRSIIENIWMEPGSDYKERLFKERIRSKLGRLPLGEKGIGRFGVHKLGHNIELISRMENKKEVYLNIDWRKFENANYLNDVQIELIERKPVVFTQGKTGTKIVINDLNTAWTRGKVRDVYRSLNSLNSPFSSFDSFSVLFRIDNKEWLKGLLSFEEIKEYALFSAEIELEGNQITNLEYKFEPWDIMTKLNHRKVIRRNIDMVYKDNKPIDLSPYKIGKVCIKLLIFDRDSNVLALGVTDRKGLKEYLNENGGIRVYRDGIRIFDYGEPGNDWLNLDIRRVNQPAKTISNNIVLGAVLLNRDDSEDLREKTNREGFIETVAYSVFRDAVVFALDKIETERLVDKGKLRNFLGTSSKPEPVISDVKILRQKVEENVFDNSLKKEIDAYLTRIETDYKYIKDVYLRSAGAGLSLSIVIHEIEKIIKELNKSIERDKTSEHIKGLVQHLSDLTQGYASIIRNKEKDFEDLRDIIRQALFNIQYRLEDHGITIIDHYSSSNIPSIVRCSKSLITGIIINIIDNSIWWTRYAKIENKKILIKITDEIPSHISIIIADNGPGFTLPTEEIVKPFISDKPGGMGLGLNIADEIMTAHGGKLLFPEYGDFSLPSEFESGAIIILAFKEERK